MNLPSPIDAVYKHLTSILSHRLCESTFTDLPCDCCKRPASEFNHACYRGIDCYGKTYQFCAGCESFNLTDISIMGIERNEKTLPSGEKTGVSHRFGMMAGSGAIITATGRVLFFSPPGTYKKLPKSFLERFDVIETTENKQLSAFNDPTLDYPLIYIQNFGKKTPALISGLRWSYSRSAVVICTDNGNPSTEIAKNTINIDLISAALAMAKKLKNSNAFKMNVRALCSGAKSPLEFTDYLNKNPECIAIFRLLPLDPHLRLSILSRMDSLL